MAWNEPGNGKDPWKRDDKEPNDLDKIVQGWQSRLGSLLGGGGGGGRSASGGGGGYFLIFFALFAWSMTGFYRIDEAERGVVQRFGDYVKTTNPGLRWRFPFPIETVTKINTIEIVDYAYQTEMLTADEQYVSIDMVVQYRRSNPEEFVFEVMDPEVTLQIVTNSALREVVGTSDLETLFVGRREDIASRTLESLQTTLNGYKAGIDVTSISLERVELPERVQAAVDDAQKARNDAERYILEADTYANDIIPKARGEAAQILEDARAYRDRVIAIAEGEAARFEALLTEYQKAPRVTRDRLYIEAVEEVYGSSNKVILDSQGSGNLLYLPIDKLIEGGGSPRSPLSDRLRSTDSQQSLPQQELSTRDESRDRRSRQ